MRLRSDPKAITTTQYTSSTWVLLGLAIYTHPTWVLESPVTLSVALRGVLRSHWAKIISNT